MVRTPICDLFDIDHPVALGGMDSATNPELVAAVSRAGGLGALGCHYQTSEQIRERTDAIRAQTNRPFGLNFLMLDTREDSFATALSLRRRSCSSPGSGPTRISLPISAARTTPAAR
jgi:NAD(P)H-dependent flavin oxidoreductase YrpB (nitropropane dioxygenase family)